ncbi:MAG TPA: ATP-grasp domain-containing protein [Candidatus Accumulibacter phosphatis]|nr:MAG: D-alanine--D-alanine ligase [Candidatus Accumulibacter sp. SK-11]HRL76433.1 ATP-grasp domain-containing protein [Candidatus Accumulibacter phosphatis]HRQ94422.1 ATP-grasp domain-containing protein [Candidatus Accumulibacter phosphatis]
MKRKLLHVLGGGPWQLPTVRLAKSMGHRVLVSDMHRERPAYALADHHEVVDITDSEATLQLAARHRIDGIICDTTDVGVVTAAFVAERLGLPGIGYETARNFTNKGRMRRLTDAAGMVVPRYCLLSSATGLAAAAAAVAYPLIVKPVDSQSGRGVSRLSAAAGLDAAYRLARSCSRSGEVLIESCVDGSEIIVDGFVVAGRPQILGTARKVPFSDSLTVSSRIHYPGALPDAEFARIRAATGATLSTLGLRDGVFHAEFMLSGEHVVPIDIAARGGGVMIYTHVVPHVSGVNVNQAMIERALGEPVQISPLPDPRAANIEFFTMPRGRIAEIAGTDAAAAVPGVAAVHFNLQVGDQVGPLEHKDRRPGYVVTLANTAAEVIAIGRQAVSLIQVRMDGRSEFVSIT